MDVSIIFVNYNTCKLTIEAIVSVYKYTKKVDFEIIVVDNDSKDNSLIEIKNLFPEVNVVKTEKILGIS